MEYVFNISSNVDVHLTNNLSLLIVNHVYVMQYFLAFDKTDSVILI